MYNYNDTYIQACLRAGILTEHVIYKYPLLPSYLGVVLKAYAIALNLPYEFSAHNLPEMDRPLYLTKEGYEWLCVLFRQHSLAHLRKAFVFVFSHAPENVLDHLDTFNGLRNLRGETGKKFNTGPKQRALLIRRSGYKGLVETKYEYDSIEEARKDIPRITAMYPASEFTLYRIRTVIKEGGRPSTFREKIPLISGRSEASRRTIMKYGKPELLKKRVELHDKNRSI